MPTYHRRAFAAFGGALGWALRSFEQRAVSRAPRRLYLGQVTLLLLIVMVTTFALLITMHVALVGGLLFRPPRWRAPVALLVAPLAPFWGFADGMHVRSVLWLLALIGYAVTRFMGA